MHIYERLGVRTVFNAVGTSTRLGGSLMCPEALTAMVEASQRSVRIEELQAAASRIIAEHTGAEAGFVTTGAFAALALATGASIARLDVRRMNRMPRWAYEQQCEVVIARHHRNTYDKAFEVAGARLVEVGVMDRPLGVGVRELDPDQLDDAITERTVAVAFVAIEGEGPGLPMVAEVAHRRGVPVIVDAAGQLPPARNLRRFIDEGADLVALSGGKALRGPQASGFLFGRRDLVASALVQQLDMDVTPAAWAPPELIPRERMAGVPYHGFGRGFKAGKEEIAGALAALMAFAKRENEYLQAGDQRCANFAAAIAGVRGVDAVYQAGAAAGKVAQVVLTFTPPSLAADVVRALREAPPHIHLNERWVDKGKLTFRAVALENGQEAVIAARFRETVESLTAGQRTPVPLDERPPTRAAQQRG